jgi:hypothetical protein
MRASAELGLHTERAGLAYSDANKNSGIAGTNKRSRNT